MARIVLIDGDATTLQITQSLLEADVHEVIAFQNGPDSLEAVYRMYAQVTTAEVIIIHLQVSGVGTLEFIQAVRADMRPLIRDVLIILTAQDFSRETGRAGVMAGADLVLPNPCDYLIRALNRLLDRR